MDTPDLSDRPHVSSVVDDVFYLLKLVLNRTLSSGSLATVRVVRESVSGIVERDYLGVLQKKMDAVYSGGGAAIGLLGTTLSGASKEAEKEKREKELRISYSASHPSSRRSTDTDPDFASRFHVITGAAQRSRSLCQLHRKAGGRDDFQRSSGTMVPGSRDPYRESRTQSSCQHCYQYANNCQGKSAPHLICAVSVWLSNAIVRHGRWASSSFSISSRVPA
jgi:hypothetical protein